MGHQVGTCERRRGLVNTSFSNQNIGGDGSVMNMPERAQPVQREQFTPLTDRILRVKEQLSCTAAAVYVIHRDTVVHESYMGSYDYEAQTLPVTASTRFNVASVRKSYLGLAVSLALHQKRISSLDDPITGYLDDLNVKAVQGTTLRHLLTHTHGLKNNHERAFPAGTGWMYNNVGINMLIRVIRKVFEAPLADVMRHYVFGPCGLTETGWQKEPNEHLVWLGESYAAEQGGEVNLFVSARELAHWGYLHLQHGLVNGKQVIPREVTERATIIQSPSRLDDSLPRNGFAWWVQDKPRPLSELGHSLPTGSYQILGKTGCACLVIPQYQLVAVRMYNQTGANPHGYDYLEDIQAFGDTVLACTLQ
ncbi:serine hydrolase domain-containing protein [Paenibacillus guangzhouensis]|uniref:serine hydrolase domain-containing protein n=1 Tax=Paenibacillus guangzhouensis TaxID=1473112 RepID=UPI001D108782|nr:serine hydrolase domain-containing protein [Paenibacillus guangzhouensis]